MDETWEARFRALVDERDEQAKWDLATALAEVMGQEQIASVVASLRSAASAERQAATRILLRATGRDRGVISQIGAEQDLVQTLETMVQSGYPQSLCSRQALKILAKVAPERATAVMRPLSIRGRSDKELRTIALDAVQFDKAGTWGVLERIAKVGGTAGALARERLEARDGLTAGDLSSLTGEWRAHRSNGSLARLYRAFVERQPIGTPLSTLCEQLGETSGRDDRGAWWNARGRSVYVTLDEDELMVAHELSE